MAVFDDSGYPEIQADGDGTDVFFRQQEMPVVGHCFQNGELTFFFSQAAEPQIPGFASRDMADEHLSASINQYWQMVSDPSCFREHPELQAEGDPILTTLSGNGKTFAAVNVEGQVCLVETSALAAKTPRTLLDFYIASVRDPNLMGPAPVDEP
jgi:hypothetical protein